MIKGLYTSALSMKAQMNKMDVISNNIANVDTTGFKKDTVLIQSFSEELALRVNDINSTFINIPKDVGGMSLGVYVQNIRTDFSTGSLKRTDSAFDIAISGDGFFAVQTTEANGDIKETYTRDGAFTLAEDGMLMTKDGSLVLGESGTITIPTGDVKIDDNGNIHSGDIFVAKLKLVSFDNNAELTKIGNNAFAKSETAVMRWSGAKVVQGFLESSNVSSIKEMVDMISLSRAYEANQRAITTHDTSIGRAVNDIARK